MECDGDWERWDVNWEGWDEVWGGLGCGLGEVGWSLEVRNGVWERWDGMEEIGLGKGIFISRRGGIGIGSGGMQVRGWNEFWER